MACKWHLHDLESSTYRWVSKWCVLYDDLCIYSSVMYTKNSKEMLLGRRGPVGVQVDYNVVHLRTSLV
jgi:hypothetical protein